MDALISPSGHPYWLMMNLASLAFGSLILTGNSSLFSYIHMYQHPPSHGHGPLTQVQYCVSLLSEALRGPNCAS